MRGLHRDRSGVFRKSVPPDPMPSARPQPLRRDDFERLLSRDRLSTYLNASGGDFADAIRLYRWNARISSAFWEPLGHLEVVLRNTLSSRLTARHAHHRRPGSWLDDPAQPAQTSRQRERGSGERASALGTARRSAS